MTPHNSLPHIDSLSTTYLHPLWTLPGRRLPAPHPLRNERMIDMELETLSPKAKAIMEFLQEIIDDLADELATNHRDVRILVRVVAR